MKAIALEIRDEGTFIPALAVDMNPDRPLFMARDGVEFQMEELPHMAAQRYLLRRCGYGCDGRPNVLLTKLSGDGSPASNDPYSWGGRTMPVAHKFIIEHWAKLKDGDVIDVEFILGEKPTMKTSERHG